jgi:SAM-dependent methyltransferase
VLGSPNLVGHQPAKLVGFIPLRVQIPPPARDKMKILRIEDALKNKKISPISPALLIAKELKIKYLIKENRKITGPAVGLSILVDRLTRNLPIKSMLDLCCGSGALSKIAKRNNVPKVVCVDKNIEAVKRNIENKTNIIIVKADVLKFEINQFFDLIVLDAPRELLQKLFKRFKHFVSNSNIFVLWHGSCEEVEWNEKVRERLRSISRVVYSFSIYGEELSASSSTEKGISWLRKFYIKW